VRLPLDEPAEAHSLYAPADHKTASLDRLFTRGHADSKFQGLKFSRFQGNEPGNLETRKL
jgi:hypothetical protein